MNTENSTPPNLLKRRVIAVLSVLLILGAARGVNTLIAANASKKVKKTPQVATVVDTLEVYHSKYKLSTWVTGTIKSLNRIDLVPEVSGTLLKSRYPFRVGTRFRKGQLLYKIDEGSARYDLLATKSSFLNQLVALLPDIKIDFPEQQKVWEEYVAQFDIQKSIASLPKTASDKERYFLASRNIFTTYYSIKSAEEKVQKYRFCAPFTGVLTSVFATEGSRVNMGQKIGEFSAGAPFEFDADIPVNIIEGVRVGDTLSLFGIDNKKEYRGTILRINKQISPKSQTVVVAVMVNDTTLLEGSYLRAQFSGKSYDDATTLPSRFIYNGNRIAYKKEGEIHFTDLEILSQADGFTTVRGLADSTVVVRR